jgi:6-phosphogluconolactonase/glucosamine-6-phosphate isomerase/deaminase
MECHHVFIITPYAIKAPIIKRLLESDVDETLPASILQTKKGAGLYLDQDSFSLAREVK